MGAAAAIEIRKPVDASDILATKSLTFAREEVIRLRTELGHLANLYKIEILSMDASDLVLGNNEDDDFHRCVEYISHIRQCLQLNTQTSKRRNRAYPTPWENEKKDLYDDEPYDDALDTSECSRDFDPRNSVLSEDDR